MAILDEAFARIDHTIENTEKNLTNVKELLKSHLNNIFTQKGSQEVDKALLKELLITQPRNGWSPPAAYHSSSGIPVLTLSSVTGFQFKKDKVKFTKAPVDNKRHYWVENGDFLLTRSNTPELVGHVAIAAGLKIPTIYPDLIMRMHPNPDKIIAKFLYYQMQSNTLREKIVGMAHGANPTMKKLTKGDVQSLPINYPSIEEQQKIVSCLDSLQAQSVRLENLYKEKNQALKEFKQSLLQKAFAGELAATDDINTAKPEYTANVIAFAYAKHAAKQRDKTFGRVKAQKALQLTEAVGRIDLGRTPIKDAAGPNDFAHMRKAERWAIENKFFEFKKRGEGYEFVKLSRFHNLFSDAQKVLEKNRGKLSKIVELLLPMNSREAELIATIHAAWNNLLLDGKEPTDDDIVYEARENWHPDKLKIPRHQFLDAIRTIRRKKLIPDGTGKRVAGQDRLI